MGRGEQLGVRRPSRTKILGLVEALESGEVLTTSLIGVRLDVGPKAARAWRRRLLNDVQGCVEVKVGRELAVVQEIDQSEQQLVATAVGLHFAVEALHPLAGTPWHDALRRMADARQVQIQELRHVAEELRSTFRVIPGGRAVEAREPLVRTISIAWKERRRIRVRYRKLNGEATIRVLDPLGLVLRGDHVLLIARDAQRAIRRYRLDRVLAVTALKERFSRPPAETVARDLAHRWGIWIDEQAQPEQVRLRVRDGFAVLVQHFRLHASQELGPDRDGWQEVTFHLCVCPEFKSWILGLLPHVQIVEPEGLRTELRSIVTDWLRNT